MALRIFASSSLLSLTSAAAPFSSKYFVLLVPGMGMKSSLQLSLANILTRSFEN
jgi:hypothetical protein